MKTLFNFLFAYGHLGWKTRLTRRDHLYHQGRNLLAVLLFTIPLAYVSIPLLGSLVAGLPFTAAVKAMPLHAVLVAVMFTALLYLSFNAIRLTVLRLHDFNRSGWWLLAFIGLAIIDALIDRILPMFSTFVSLQNLAYLGLLIMPGQAIPNRFGNPDDNSTEGKLRIIRGLPLVMFAVAWLLGIASLFSTQQVIKQAELSQRHIDDSERKIQEVLSKLENDPEFKKLTEQFGEPTITVQPEPASPTESIQ